MSMDLPPIQQREFILEPKSSNSDDFDVFIRNSIPSSINNFLHADNMTLSEIYRKGSSAALKGLLGINVFLLATESMNALVMNSDSIHPPSLEQNVLFSRSLVMGLNIAIMAAFYGMDALSGHYLMESMKNVEQKEIPVIEKESLPTNNAKLREDVYAVAIQSGIMPVQFTDLITLAQIETPVAFENDPTATIYDLESVNLLRQRNVARNPFVQNLQLDFNKLVYLPEVKKQIDAIAKKEGKVVGEDEADEGIDERTIGLKED